MTQGLCERFQSALYAGLYGSRLYHKKQWSMMIEIRSAGPGDYPLIREVAHRTWPDTFGNILSKEQISYMLEMMYSLPSLREQVEKKGHHFILAFREAECVGYASYETHFRGLPVTKIHKIYVLTNQQGKGTGKQLIETIAEAARQQQNHSLSLNVNRENPAIRFYLRHGFEKVNEENIPIGQGFFMEDFVMEKKLEMS